MSQALVRKTLESVDTHDRMTHVQIELHRDPLLIRLPQSASQDNADITSARLISIHLHSPALIPRSDTLLSLPVEDCLDEQGIMIIVDAADELDVSIVRCQMDNPSFCLLPPYCPRGTILLRATIEKCHPQANNSATTPVAKEKTYAQPYPTTHVSAQPYPTTHVSAQPYPTDRAPSSIGIDVLPIGRLLPIGRPGVTDQLLIGLTCLKGINDIRVLYSVLSNGIEAHINKCKVKEFMVLQGIPLPTCAVCNLPYVQQEVKAGTKVSASCQHNSEELLMFTTTENQVTIDPCKLGNALLLGEHELQALREWKTRALCVIKAQELSSFAQRERAFLVSHNIASADLNAPDQFFDLIRNETGEVDEEAQLMANLEACSSNMQWFEDTSSDRARFRFKLTIAPPADAPDKFRIITARAAPHWTGLVKALTNNWDNLRNRPTRTLLNAKVSQAIETRKRKRPISRKSDKKA
jgi:hypothetical protein